MHFALHLSDIAPALGAPRVVCELHLDVQGGDRVAILGPSGSGKTTVLRAIMGSAVARRLADGINVTDVEKLREEGLIGYVPQNTLIFPWLSVAENVRLPFRIHNRQPDEARVDDLIDALSIRGFLDSGPTMLSGGMAVRVATARALVLSPQLLLIDEAFAALDEFLRYEVWANVMREMQRGVTIFVTHSVTDAAAFASHAVVLNGRTPSHATTVTLRPTAPTYPPVQSDSMSENINSIRRVLHP